MPLTDCVSRGRYRCRELLVLTVLSIGLTACNQSADWTQFSNHAARPTNYHDLKREVVLYPEPVRALQGPDSLRVKTVQVRLGKQLFHDKRLSGDGSLSCASCHDISKGGDDGRATSVGIRGQMGSINAPTVLNSGHNFRQFWDGRATSLAHQALGPVANPMEMGAHWTDVVERLSSDEVLLDLFDEAFGTRKIESALIAEAIATFERTLVTPAPFDRYLNGNRAAISPEAVQGYALFKEYGCIACHQGVNLGGNLMQYFGAFHMIDADEGGQARGRSSDHPTPVYKVPTLRNIAVTAPYFHTGSVSTLSDAVRVMGAAQLGRIIDEADIALIVVFLESLTGEIPEHALAPLQTSSVE